MRKQIQVLDVPIDVVTMDSAIQTIKEWIPSKGFHMIATANAEMVMMANQDKELMQILCESHLVVPDGAGVLWAAEQKGDHFPERVAGCDLVKALLKECAREAVPIYFLGAAPGIAEKAISNVEKEVGSLTVAGLHSGFFTSEEEQNILQTIEDKDVKFVFVALGVPKQEKWIKEKLSHMNVIAIGVGGTFDVLAGHVKRAPLWMQKNRLEWLYRLYKQPQRLMRMMALPKFMWAVKTSKK